MQNDPCLSAMSFQTKQKLFQMDETKDDESVSSNDSGFYSTTIKRNDVPSYSSYNQFLKSYGKNTIRSVKAPKSTVKTEMFIQINQDEHENAPKFPIDTPINIIIDVKGTKNNLKNFEPKTNSNLKNKTDVINEIKNRNNVVNETAQKFENKKNHNNTLQNKKIENGRNIDTNGIPPPPPPQPPKTNFQSTNQFLINEINANKDQNVDLKQGRNIPVYATIPKGWKQNSGNKMSSPLGNAHANTLTKVPVTDDTKNVDKNDPKVKTLVYRTYRDLLGAYQKDNQNAEENKIAKLLNEIQKNGGIEHLNGRTNPKPQD